MEIVREDAIRSPFSGRKPRRREDTARSQTTARWNQGLTNSALEGRDQKEAEGRSIVTGWRNSPGTGGASTREREAKGRRWQHGRRRERTCSRTPTDRMPTLGNGKEGKWRHGRRTGRSRAQRVEEQLASQAHSTAPDPARCHTDVYACVCSCRQCWASKCRGL
jgi:hypothetical protein